MKIDDVIKEPYIRTISNFSLQRTNKLKGMAMEALILHTFKSTKSKVDTQINISSILNKINPILKRIYRVKKPFRLIVDDKVIQYVRTIQESEEFRSFFNVNDLTEGKYIVEYPEEFEKTISKIKRVKEETGWYQCSFCGQKLPGLVCERCEKYISYVIDDINSCKCGAKTLPKIYIKTHKCRKCRQGFFQKEYRSVKDETFKEKKVIEWVKKKFENIDELVNFLRGNHFIPMFGFVRSLRPDFCKIKDTVWIYDSKNKEKTGLKFYDIAKLAFYIYALRECGIGSNEGRIIFNGCIDGSVLEYLPKFNNFRKINIQLKSIEEWLKNYHSFTGRAVTNIKMVKDNSNAISCGKYAKYGILLEFSDNSNLDFISLNLNGGICNE